MSRRTKIIIAIVLIALVIAALVWYFFFARKPAPAVPEGGAFPAPSKEAILPEEAPTALPERAPGAFRPILRHLTTTPVAGAVIGGKDKNVRVRYQDRATGNTFEISATGGAAKRLTNTTVAKIYEALWRPDGAALIARFLAEDGETIQTYSATLKPKTEGEGALEGVFLPGDIRDIALSPDGKEILYIREEKGNGVGIRAAFNGAGKIEVFRSPLSEWIPLWSAPANLLFQTKPSAIAEGMLVSVPSAGGEGEPIIRGVRGLTTLPDHALTTILFSQSTDSGISLGLLNRKTNTVHTLPLTTFPEKCVWAKSNLLLFCGVPVLISGGSYPDAWYQGVVSFTDEAWSISASDDKTKLIMDVSTEAGEPLDVINPSLSPDERFLLFTNKNDLTLWSLQLAQ